MEEVQRKGREDAQRKSTKVDIIPHPIFFISFLYIFQSIKCFPSAIPDIL